MEKSTLYWVENESVKSAPPFQGLVSVSPGSSIQSLATETQEPSPTDNIVHGLKLLTVSEQEFGKDPYMALMHKKEGRSYIQKGLLEISEEVDDLQGFVSSDLKEKGEKVLKARLSLKYRNNSTVTKQPSVSFKEPAMVRKVKLFDEFQDDIKLQLGVGKPKRTLDDIIGYVEIKLCVVQAYVYPSIYEKDYPKVDLEHCLLIGPPGVGKTLFAEAIAHSFAAESFVVATGADLNGRLCGDSEKKLRAMFDMVKETGKKAAIFFDELESLMPCRTSNRTTQYGLVAEFLSITSQPFMNEKKILLIAATNLPDNIDEAVKRRFTLQLTVSLPDADTKKELFKYYLEKPKEVPHPGEYFFEYYLKDYSCDDVRRFAQNLNKVPFFHALSAEYFHHTKAEVDENGVVTAPAAMTPCMDEPCRQPDDICVKFRYVNLPNNAFIKMPSITVRDILAVANCMEPTVIFRTSDKPTSNMADSLAKYEGRKGFSQLNFLKEWGKNPKLLTAPTSKWPCSEGDSCCEKVVLCWASVWEGGKY